MYDNKINMTSVAMLIITALLLVILGIAGLGLKNARNKNNFDSLPDLEVIEERTDPVSTTRTTTTRATEVVESPYYEIKLDNYLTDDYYFEDTRKAENTGLILDNLVTEANKILNTDDFSLIDSSRLLQFVKDDEIDRIVYGGNEYVIMYNGKEVLSRIFTKQFIDELIYIKYDNKPLFIIYRDNYYRIAPLKINQSKMQKIELIRGTNKLILGTTVYRRNEYNVEIIYEDGRWKIDLFEYPNYTKEVPEKKEEESTTTTTTTTSTTTTTIEEVTSNENANLQ